MAPSSRRCESLIGLGLLPFICVSDYCLFFPVGVSYPAGSMSPSRECGIILIQLVPLIVTMTLCLKGIYHWTNLYFSCGNPANGGYELRGNHQHFPTEGRILTARTGRKCQSPKESVVAKFRFFERASFVLTFQLETKGNPTTVNPTCGRKPLPLALRLHVYA